MVDFSKNCCFQMWRRMNFTTLTNIGVLCTNNVLLKARIENWCDSIVIGSFSDEDWQNNFGISKTKLSFT